MRRLRTRLGVSAPPRKRRGDEPPLRAELFSADQMALHGKALAASHKLAPGRAPDRLLARLAANESALVGVCSLLTEEATESRRITPAGEWLLDNFYLIEEQIRTAKRHLPKGYSRELPRLAQGPSAGRPRVYDIALETISHGDGRVDTEGLSRFVAAYQSVTALRLGELWAIPIMLRLALIENLRRVAVRIAVGRSERNLAGAWADQMTETAQKDPKSLILVIADMARSNPPLVSAFVAELARRLQGRGPALVLPLTWIEQRLSESGLTIEQLIQAENQQQAANQVSISNSIGSLRVLGATDWREFVETMSVVEQALREDPADAYGRMDFITRDRYRHAAERMAKRSPLSEGELARTAIRLARAAAESGAQERAGHVGYYLIDKGLPELERAAQVRLSGAQTWRRAAGRFPLLLYVGAITLIAAIISGSVLAQAPADAVPDWLLGLIGILSLLAASQLALALVNWLATLLVTPYPLPRLDFSAGIPPQARTLVVVPTMLSSAQNAEDLIEALEVTFLANRDQCLHFGLLTDFPDAQQESLARGRAAAAAGPGEDRRAEREIRRRRGAKQGRHLLPVPSPAALERAGTAVDGLRAQARQACGPERAAARRLGGSLFARRRRQLAPVRSEVRHHAGHRYATAARCGAAVRRRHGAPAQSPALRRNEAARGGGLRHPATARGGEPAGHEPLALCAPVRGRAGYRPVHARRLGRVPGRVRRGLVHRQGDLRRRCVRAGPRRALARKSDPQPRSAGGLLRARGAGERCTVVRELSVPLQDGREPAPALDSRRLAARGVAARDGSGRGCAPSQESALAAVAMEAVRQPAAQPRSGGAGAAIAARMDGPCAGLAVDLAGVRHHPRSIFVRLDRRALAQARRGAVAAAPRGRRTFGLAVLHASRIRARLPPVRGVLQPGCDRAHGLAHAGRWQRIARMESVRRDAPQTAQGQPRRSRRLFALDVGRTRRRRRHGDPSGGRAPGGVGAGGADTAVVVRLARHRVVVQPPARAPRGDLDARADALPARACAPHLGVLRELRRPGKPLAAARQLPGVSRCHARASHVADQHGARAAGESVRLRLRLSAGRTAHGAHGAHPAHDGRAGALPGALLQLVRHADAAAAAAAVRLDGRQRESRRPSADLACGAACAGRRRDTAGAAVRWLERHARPARGRGAIAQGAGVGVRCTPEDARRSARMPRAAGRRGCRRSRRRGRGGQLGAGARAPVPRGAR